MTNKVPKNFLTPIIKTTIFIVIFYLYFILLLLSVLLRRNKNKMMNLGGVKYG